MKEGEQVTSSVLSFDGKISQWMIEWASHTCLEKKEKKKERKKTELIRTFLCIGPPSTRKRINESRWTCHRKRNLVVQRLTACRQWKWNFSNMPTLKFDYLRVLCVWTETFWNRRKKLHFQTKPDTCGLGLIKLSTYFCWLSLILWPITYRV